MSKRPVPPVGASVTVAADCPIHPGSKGEVVAIDPDAYDGYTHKVQLANYWLWFRPQHLVQDWPPPPPVSPFPTERTRP